MAKSKANKESVTTRCIKCRTEVIDVSTTVGRAITVDADQVKTWTLSVPVGVKEFELVAKPVYSHAEHVCPEPRNP